MKSLALAGAMSAIAVRFAFGAVTETQFPPQTARDLLAICSADKDDPMMTAALNYCRGFVEGAVDVEEAYESRPGARRLFCIPTPRPSHSEALAAFTAWINTDPSRIDRPSIDALFEFLANAYPCATASGKPK